MSSARSTFSLSAYGSELSSRLLLKSPSELLVASHIPQSLTLVTPYRHPEYRTPLICHILDIGLTHYDPDIRILAASSLQALVELDPASLAPDLIPRQASLRLPEPLQMLANSVSRPQILHLATKDVSKLHGALLSLSALAESVSRLDEAARAPLMSQVRLRAAVLGLLPAADPHPILPQIFSAVASLPPALRALRSSPLVLSATLQALSSSCTTEAATASLSGWRGLLHLAGEKGDEEVHLQAALAMRRMSATVDCSADLDG